MVKYKALRTFQVILLLVGVVLAVLNLQLSLLQSDLAEAILAKMRTVGTPEQPQLQAAFDAALIRSTISTDHSVLCFLFVSMIVLVIEVAILRKRIKSVM